MSNHTIVTVRGFAGGSPTMYTNTYNSQTGAEYARDTTVLRMGVTPSYYNRAEEEFQDGQTAWYTVRTYGALAANVAQCVQRGTPLIVRGRLTVRSYVDRNDNPRDENVILADAVGVEMSNGVVTYSKRSSAKLEAIDGEPEPRGSEEREDLDQMEDGTSGDGTYTEEDTADPAGVLAQAQPF